MGDVSTARARTAPAARKTAVKKAAAPKTAAKKAVPAARAPRKAAARKTTAVRKVPAAPPAKKTPAKKATPRKKAAKKPVRTSTAKAGTTRAKKFSQRVKYARKHPFTASLAVLLVVTTVAWRGTKAGGRLLRSGVTKAWARGEDDRLNRRAAKKAAEATAAGHKGCPACKGTGVLPKHNADGTWAGSIRCTKSAARRARA
ncbi:hypothetical protein ACIQXD_36670 [Streptomyces uncialis]|uniref:hypothetical protein n=1 Tax=Streptomyces uncialis TaxID=1048205 RepID=UPI0038175297